MIRWMVALVVTLMLPWAAHAFCGFYVSGADASLYSSATMVVMMRHENTTVLSMQNNYQGPPEDFAMVVPVPVVLSEETVKTLPREVFDRVDRLAAPRLVEYWEADPCNPPPDVLGMLRGMTGAWTSPAGLAMGAGGLGVTVEAEFSVAEYDIVILSAEDSGGLDTWLRREGYNIPAGAEGALRPYVEAGTKFFVAKVAADRVTFEDGRAVLSPLRFHYESDEFSLPVRLGLLNSAGQQDLLVHILASGRRYEVANYPNATIPTNIVVDDATRWGFGDFYDLLFRRTVAQNEGAVVTEYSWNASSCDPCPVPALTDSEVMTLGGDVTHVSASSAVLTRLHHRYTSQGLSEDLVFREASAIVGGRGMPDREGKMSEESAAPSSSNNFQGRYVILHRWEGEIACDTPERGHWGAPPGQPMPIWGAPAPLLREAEAPPDPPEGLAAVTAIGLLSKVDVPAIGVRAGQAEGALANDPGAAGVAPTAMRAEPSREPEPSMGAVPTTTPQPSASREGGCGSCATSGGSWFTGLLLLVWARRRR